MPAINESHQVAAPPASTTQIDMMSTDNAAEPEMEVLKDESFSADAGAARVAGASDGSVVDGLKAGRGGSMPLQITPEENRAVRRKIDMVSQQSPWTKRFNFLVLLTHRYAPLRFDGAGPHAAPPHRLLLRLHRKIRHVLRRALQFSRRRSSFVARVFVVGHDVLPWVSCVRVSWGVRSSLAIESFKNLRAKVPAPSQIPPSTPTTQSIHVRLGDLVGSVSYLPLAKRCETKVTESAPLPPIFLLSL